MVRWSWDAFWDTVENFTPLWFALAVTDALIGLGLVYILLSQPFDTSDPSVVVATVDLAIVAVTLVPLCYVLYRIRQLKREEY
ncbi:hypothetical protein GCM10009037_23010 [Halarchaeum grantii]|uniref:Uncharacterized protein n=1 Tax=Halarchaeum grantii TaxID=1193105 RepID=A0A830FBR2_9EURY|nr:hypothetical protein [Halarchaeum grantii]GGL38780.1 hypothetical protein GCM10009037_23010 [Halarchaeum grantii]